MFIQNQASRMILKSKYLKKDLEDRTKTWSIGFQDNGRDLVRS